MSWIKDIIVRFKGDSGNLQAETKKAEKSVSGFGEVVKKLGPMLLGAFSASAIINFGKQAVKAFRESEFEANRLLTALNGNRVAQSRLIAQANALQKTTIFSDEEVVKAQSMLAVLIKDADVIERLTPLVLDFAVAKSMDLKSAADIVAKSVGSEVNALSRYGIAIEGAAGSSQRLEMAMSGLSRTVNGQATAAAETATGAVEQLRNSFEDLTEELGGQFSPKVEASQRVLTSFLNKIKDFVTSNEFKFFKQGLGGIVARRQMMIDEMEKQFVGPMPFEFSAEDISQQLAEDEEKLKKAAEERIKTLTDLRDQQLALLKEIRGYVGTVNGKDVFDLTSQPSKIERLPESVNYEFTGPEQYSNKINTASGLAPSSGRVMGQESNFAPSSEDLQAWQAITGYAENFKVGIEEASEAVEYFMDVSQRMKETIGDALMMMGSQLAQGAESWDEYGKSVVDALKSAIGMIIKEGVAITIRNTLAEAGILGPIGLGLAALAGGLAGGIFTTALNQIPSFAGGGYVDRPTLAMVGDAKDGRGEWVLNSQQMRAMQQGGGGVLTTEVSGRNLKIVLDRENAFQNRT